MKKLLMISGAINYGAPGRIVEQIGLLAQESRYEVLVAHSSRNSNPSDLSHFSVTSKFQELYHALGAKFFDLHGLLSTRQTKALIQKIKEYNPERIICVFGAGGNRSKLRRYDMGEIAGKYAESSCYCI